MSQSKKVAVHSVVCTEKKQYKFLIKYQIIIKSLLQKEVMEEVAVMVIVRFVMKCKWAAAFGKSMKLGGEVTQHVVQSDFLFEC